MKKLKVLVACEEQQRVCTEFRKLGHEAYSADIQEPSGGHPEFQEAVELQKSEVKHFQALPQLWLNSGANI